MKQLTNTKNLLQSVEDLRLVEPNVFVAPFLEVLRSAYTPGQITSLALSALNKFLSYGLIGKCAHSSDKSRREENLSLCNLPRGVNKFSLWLIWSGT